MFIYYEENTEQKYSGKRIATFETADAALAYATSRQQNRKEFDKFTAREHLAIHGSYSWSEDEEERGATRYTIHRLQPGQILTLD